MLGLVTFISVNIVNRICFLNNAESLAASDSSINSDAASEAMIFFCIVCCTLNIKLFSIKLSLPS